MATSPFAFDTPNTAIDLTTVDLVKGYLRIKSELDDSLIQLCITAASYEWIWRTGRGDEGQIVSNSPFVAPVAYDETYDGSGSYVLMLRNWPIVSVESVIINGVVASPSTGYGFPGWLIDKSKKWLAMRTAGKQSKLGRAPCGLGFDEGIQNIEVQYHAGFSAVPPQIVKACTQMVAVNYKRTDWLDQSSKAMGAQGVTGTTSYRSWELPPEVLRVMHDFTRDWIA